MSKKQKNEVVRLVPEGDIPKEGFNVYERLFLLNGVLPPVGNFTTIKIIQQLKNELSFSEEEHDRYEIKIIPSGGVTVTKDEAKLKEAKLIHIGKRARDVIVNGLKEMDRKKQLSPGHIILYERFVGAVEDSDGDE